MIEYLDRLRAPIGPAVICLGFFDGVHLGHKAIVDVGLDTARQMMLPLYVHSYDRSPASLIRKGNEPSELTTIQEKDRLLSNMGADLLVISRFDEALMRMPGEAFVRQVLLEKLQARHLVVGFDHRFGYRGGTGTDELTALCHSLGLGLSVVPAVKTADGQVISSTAIRQALARGDWQAAEQMLGRPPDDKMKNLGRSLDSGEQEAKKGGRGLA